MSTEAIFAKLKKPSPIKKKVPSPKKKSTKSNEKSKQSKTKKSVLQEENNEIPKKQDESDSSFNLVLESDNDSDNATVGADDVGVLDNNLFKSKESKFKNKNQQISKEQSDSELIKGEKKSKLKNKKVTKIIKSDDEEMIPSDYESDKKTDTKRIKSSCTATNTTKVRKTKKTNKTNEEDEDDQELINFLENTNNPSGKLEHPEPLFKLNSDGTLPQLPNFVYKILEKDFGHKTFRPHQAEAILRIACGLSTVVVLSTGYGKSLIYQMATKLYAKRYSIF
jgi:hypothetical protein